MTDWTGVMVGVLPGGLLAWLIAHIEERYGSTAILVTSQRPIGEWHAYLGAGRIADAILDHLIHNAHRIELNSKESLRKDRAVSNHGVQSEL
jgi:DNA replication protein DnaC